MKFNMNYDIEQASSDPDEIQKDTRIPRKIWSQP